MDCPVCKEPMIVLEYEEIEVDFCTECKGVWLDAGELELLFGDRQITEGFMTAGDRAAASKEKARRCPECRKPMEKYATGGEHPVTYDKCRRGDGLWFDHGELGVVLKYGSPAAGGDKVAKFLQETFGSDSKSNT